MEGGLYVWCPKTDVTIKLTALKTVKKRELGHTREIIMIYANVGVVTFVCVCHFGNVRVALKGYAMRKLCDE